MPRLAASSNKERSKSYCIPLVWSVWLEQQVGLRWKEEEERWIRQGIKARRTRNEGRVRALQEMRMQDSLAQLSVLSFDRIRLNEPVEAGAFTLDYPEGVDIIRDGA